MQLKFLVYFAAAVITLVSARSTAEAVDDFTSGSLTLHSKAAALHQGIDAITYETSIGDLLTMRDQVNELMIHANIMTDSITGRLSTEQYNKIVNDLEPIQLIVELAAKSIVDKKQILDSLPTGFGRVSSLVGLTLHELKGSRDGMKNAILAAVPDSCLSDAHGVAQKWDSAWNAALAAYT